MDWLLVSFKRRNLAYVCKQGAALVYVNLEDGCALAGLLVGGKRVGDAARRGERVHLTVAALNAPERSIECVRRVHLFDGGHVHAGVNAPLCALRVRRERRRHGLVVERNVGCFVACQVAIDAVAVHALAVCVAELGRVDDALVAVSVGVVCALACALAVVAAAAFGAFV